MSNPVNTGLLPTLYTVKEVASYCKVSIRTVRRWISAKQLLSTKVGGQHRIAANDLALFWLNGRKNNDVILHHLLSLLL